LSVVRLLCAAAFAAAASCARAAEPEAPPAAFRVEIAAPAPLDVALRDNLDIMRWQGIAAMRDSLTDGLLERLLAEARAQAREIAATRGFFSPEVDVRAEAVPAGRIVRVAVVPGEPTRVRAVRIEFTGPVTEAPDGAVRMKAVREAWPLRAGDVFTQQGWDAAKAVAIATLSDERYAAAGIASSRAAVDPGARAADLEVTLASGPPVVFGALAISGLERHPESAVRNLSPIRPGDPYSREKLEVYQRRLIATNYFASVQVGIDADPANPGVLPVKVALIEAPKRKVDVGVGYSTDTLFRFQLDYRDVDFLDLNHRLTSTLRWETRVQALTGSLESPPNADGWYNVYTADLRATQIQNLDTHAVSAGFVRKLADERNQPAWGVGYIFERQEPQGLPADDTYALVGSLWYTWRRTDELLTPRRGWNAAVQLAAAPPGVSSREFGRVIGKLAGFVPLARNLDGIVRAEAGAVIAETSSGIPQAMLFRTGGDTTVRGYSFESLGVKSGDAIVGGRYYGLASAEAVYWAWENVGIAAFVDAGNATDDLGDFRFAVGYGLGGRARTPAGPLRLDVAYGRDARDWRIHFSFGLTF
jgi:translocation and assembly module TamA